MMAEPYPHTGPYPYCKQGLTPAVGTAIRGQGRIVYHDRTRSGLHRCCIETVDRYPDLETWCELLNDKPLQRHRYTEKLVAGVCICYLWFYWKEGE